MGCRDFISTVSMTALGPAGALSHLASPATKSRKQFRHSLEVLRQRCMVECIVFKVLVREFLVQLAIETTNVQKVGEFYLPDQDNEQSCRYLCHSRSSC